jgi:hypothetical protein
MKKLVLLILTVSVMALSLFGCGASSKHFSGEWRFSKISEVKLMPEIDETSLGSLKEYYGAQDVDALVATVLGKFATDGVFEPCYVKFGKKLSYTYDPVMEREATWRFYQTGECEGFLSFYTELDASLGNPDPTNNPDVVYNAETDTLLVTLQYSAFMVTVEMSR